MGVQGVSIFAESSVDVQSVSLFTASSKDLQGFPLPLSCNAGMLDCTASDQSGTGIYKNADAGNSPVPE
jgi:hypothetical protein